MAARRPSRALVFAITATGIMANPLVAPAIPEMLDDLDAARSQAGLLVAAGTLPGIVVAPLIGVLADRYGRRAVLVPCLVLFGLFGVAASFAPSFPVLLALRLGQGVGSAGLVNLAVVIIGDHWEGGDRARVLGQNAAVLMISVAVLPLVGGFLTDLGSWRWAFGPYAVGLVTAALLRRRLPPTAVRHEDSGLAGELGEAVRIVARPPLRGAVSYGVVLFVLIFGLYLTVLPLHLEERFDLGPGSRGGVLAVRALTSGLGGLLIGRLQPRFGRQRLQLASTVMFAVSFAAIGVTSDVTVMLASVLLFGLAEGLVIPVLQDLVTGEAPARSRGAVVAVWVGAARLGQTAGPLLAGAGLAVVSTGAAFVVGAAVTAAIVLPQLGRKRDYGPVAFP